MENRWVRWMARLLACAAALTFAMLASRPSRAQAPLPVGAQFQVNTYTMFYQGGASVAADADGDFVVVWTTYASVGTDTSVQSIQGQRFTSNGSPLGAQFQVNSYTTSYQGGASVAADADGDFVVVWGSQGSPGTDPDFRSVQGQRYASNGSPQGVQFQVNTYTTSFQSHPSISAEADGDFVVVWSSLGSYGSDSSSASVQGQRFSSNGSMLGAQFQINTYTTNQQVDPSVATDADGDFVVVWFSNGSFGTDTSSGSIEGQRYASNGSPLGVQFQVNSYTTGFQDYLSVAADSDGDFVVVWQSQGSPGTDTSDRSIQGQRYASSGAAEGAQFQVNTYTTSSQKIPAVAAGANGDFVVAWHSYGSVGTDASYSSIQGQRYASSGSMQGAQFQVNSYTTGYQVSPAVAAAPDGNFVVVWRSAGNFLAYSAHETIEGQRYRVAAPAPLVPAMSSAARSAFAAALMLFGGVLALRHRA